MTEKTFTLAQLAQYDGQDGHQPYFAYEGTVYDASGIPNWQPNQNHGLLAGKDITEEFNRSPHGAEMFEKMHLPVVGKLVEE